MLTDDFAIFFSSQDFAVSAAWSKPSGGMEIASVLFDSPDRDLLSGHMQATHYQISYPITALVGLKRGDSITIAGAIYTVLSEPDSAHDGRIKHAQLSKT